MSARPVLPRSSYQKQRQSFPHDSTQMPEQKRRERKGGGERVAVEPRNFLLRECEESCLKKGKHISPVRRDAAQAWEEGRGREKEEEKEIATKARAGNIFIHLHSRGREGEESERSIRPTFEFELIGRKKKEKGEKLCLPSADDQSRLKEKRKRLLNFLCRCGEKTKKR